MNKALIATSNKGKLTEISALMQTYPIDLVSLGHLKLFDKVEENGNSYAENAAKKATYFANQSGLLTIADDTGLELEVLNGLPGIRSARFSPLEGAKDADRRQYLIEKLQSFPQPWIGRFICVVALALPGGKIYFSRGECVGEIIPQERGDYGFGYDPIFFLPELNQTLAELPIDIKNQISHRGQAIRAIIPKLLKLINTQDLDN